MGELTATFDVVYWELVAFLLGSTLGVCASLQVGRSLDFIDGSQSFTGLIGNLQETLEPPLIGFLGVSCRSSHQ